MTVDTARIDGPSSSCSRPGGGSHRDGLVKTPGRVARMYEEVLAGFGQNPVDHLEVTFAAEHDEMVMVRDIPFALPVRAPPGALHREAHVAYIPGDDGRITGLSRSPGWWTVTPNGSRSRNG